MNIRSSFSSYRLPSHGGVSEHRLDELHAEEDGPLAAHDEGPRGGAGLHHRGHGLQPLLRLAAGQGPVEGRGQQGGQGG